MRVTGAITAIIAASAALVVAGCGSNAPIAKAGPSPSATAVTSPAHGSTYVSSAPHLDSAAVKKYGKAEVEAATRTAVSTAETYGMRDRFIRAKRLSEGDAKSMLGLMTPTCAREFLAILANGADNNADLDAFVVVNVHFTNDKVSLATSGPVVTHPTISHIRSLLGTDGSIQVSLRNAARWRVVYNHRPALQTVENRILYWLTYDRATRTWKIDGWDGDYRTLGRPVPNPT